MGTAVVRKYILSVDGIMVNIPVLIGRRDAIKSFPNVSRHVYFSLLSMGAIMCCWPKRKDLGV